MSTNYSIVIVPKPDGFIPSDSTLVDLLDNVSPDFLENSESWQKPERFVGEDGSSSWSVGATSKWGVDGVSTFALLVSENYPVVVERTVTFDGDDYSEEQSTYVDGKLTEFSETVPMRSRVIDGEIAPLAEEEWARAHEIAADPCGHDDDEVRTLIELLIFLAGGPAQ